MIDPFGNSRVPKHARLLLYVSDHGAEFVASSMMTCFETLNAAGRSVPTEDVFALIPIRAFWRWQPFAFDRQQCVKVNVAAACDPDDNAGW